MRRYCAANRLNRLGTLTYAGAGCFDPREVRADVGEFFRDLRLALGGKPFPYAWVPEWHKAHGLHVHFAVGRYIHHSLIASTWSRGFVGIDLIGDLPIGSGTREEARKAAAYLSKYVTKSFDDPRVSRLHRFDVAQGFQPPASRVYGRTVEEALGRAVEVMDGVAPAVVWHSEDSPLWQGPPSVWASWAG